MRLNSFSLCAILYLYCESYSLHAYLLIRGGVESWGDSLVILGKKKTKPLANQKLNQGIGLEQKVSNLCVHEQQEWGKFLMILELQFKVILTLHELAFHPSFPTGHQNFPARAILWWTKLRNWSELKLIRKKKRQFYLWLVPWSSSMSSSANISASPREEAKRGENKLSGREGGQDCCLRQQC